MLKYNVHGNKNGKAIIFINGAGIGPWMWNNQLAGFLNYKCITFDLPGHGKNTEQIFINIEECIKEINEIILKESGTESVVLIGHSIGAQIIMSMLSSNIKNISHAVIVSGLNKPMKNMLFIVKWMVTLTMPLVKYKWFSKLQAKELSIPDDKIQNYYEDSLLLSKQTFKNIIVENMSLELKDELDTNTKTLVLVGSNEKKIMIESGKKTLKVIKDSRGFILINAGHGIPYEKPILFNEIVSSFIKDEEINKDSNDLLKL